MTVRRLNTIAEVDDLVAALFDPARVDPTIVVTTRNREAEPLLDVDALARAVAPQEVLVLPTGDLTRHLTATLPDLFGVFGGASRIWWPGMTRSDSPHRHPLIFAYTTEEAPRAQQRLRSELDRHVDQRYLLTRTAPPPAVALATHLIGDELDGLVLEAMPGGGEVDLGDGLKVWVVRRKREPELVVGESIRVLVTGYDGSQPLLRRLPSPTLDQTVEPAQPAAETRPTPRQPASTPTPAAREAGLAELQDQVEDARRTAQILQSRAESAEEELADALRAKEREIRELKKESRSLKDQVKHLKAKLLGGADETDAEDAFRAQVQRAWEANYLGADRNEWPMQDFAIGERLLDSLAAFPELRAKIAEVCAEVVSGRFRVIPGREHHALRIDAGGDSAQRTRADNALAFRIAVQIKSPGARRLHYWRMPDGTAELACVVHHDDMSIA